MKADLHNHSNYSDGILSVKDLILRAKNNGVNAMALTDHDCVFGVDEAYNEGLKVGVFVVKGMELSTYYKGRFVHILAFFKENKVPQELYDFSKNVIDKRNHRARKMMENIEHIFHVQVDYEDLFKGTIITRGNMFRSLQKSNPNLTKEEINQMVCDDSKAYIPASKLETKEGVLFLKKLGATLVLAHPCLIHQEDLEDILSLGFDGIEAYYPKNMPGDFERFLNLAQKYHLFLTAGSDYHGDVNHADIGTSTLTEEQFDIVLKKLNLK